MASWVKVGSVSQIKPGTVGYADVDGQRVAVCNADGAFYVIDDECTHDGGPLDQGVLQGCQIECPRHGARFDVRTGKVTALPAVVPIGTYPVRVDGDDILIDRDA